MRLIIGRAGSGKTQKIIQEILADTKPLGSPLILLTPEQATFQYEKLLLERQPGMLQIQVLSFPRLAGQILQETGGAMRIHIGELGRQMLLRRLVQKNQEQLTVLGRSARQKNFSRVLAKAIGELKNYAVDYADLQKFTQQHPGLLNQKLNDLALLYQNLEEILGQHYTDPEDYLNLLIQQIPASGFLEQAKIWVDGFKSFTQQELRILTALQAKSRQLTLSLCLDPRRSLKSEDLFYSVQQTRQALKPIEETLVLSGNPRFHSSPALAYLEANYDTFAAAPFAEDPANQLEIAAATSLQAEIEGAIGKIEELVRNRGWQWRDIMILVRDLKPYQDLIKPLFAEAQIPYFLDQKETVLYHPLVELLNCVLEIARKNWSYEPVFRYLKTDFSQLGRNEVDLLENLVLAKNIRSWRKQWDFPEQPEAESWRQQVVQELETTVLELQKPDLTGQEIIHIVYNFCLELGVPQRLQEWQETARKQEADYQEASEQKQIWDLLVGLWEEMGQALGQEKLSLAEFADILNSGLESLNLGFIPPALDQVIVGVLDRSYTSEVKAVLILGAGENVLPARLADNGFFSDAEREQLAADGLKLGKSKRCRIWEEQFLIYQALSRASHYLYLSYPLADQEGQNLYPSPLILRLKKMFPHLQENILRDEPLGSLAEQMKYLTCPGRCLGYLGNKLKDLQEKGLEPEPLWQEVYVWLKNSKRWQEALQQMEKGIFFTNEVPDLQPELRQACYGRRLYSSITRLEKYGACPFSYFLNYTLKLQERSIYSFKAPEIGNLFHRVLQKYFQLLPDDPDSWGKMSVAEITDLLQQIMQDPDLQPDNSREQGLMRRLQRQLLRTLLIMREHFRQGEFWPAALELDFSNSSWSEEIVLSGKIDRLDLAEQENEHFIRVLDYKSSRREWEQKLYEQGIDLQLPVYLKIGQELYQKKQKHAIRPAGMFYLTVEDPLLSITDPEKFSEQERLKAHKLQGVLLEDEQVIRLMDREIEKSSLLLPVALTSKGIKQSSKVLSKVDFQQLLDSVPQIIEKLGQNIRAGRIMIQPYRYKEQKACRFCPYHAVCQFDPIFACNDYKQID